MVKSRERHGTLAGPSEHCWGGVLEQDEVRGGRAIAFRDGVEAACARDIACVEHFFVVPMPLLSINK